VLNKVKGTRYRDLSCAFIVIIEYYIMAKKCSIGSKIIWLYPNGDEGKIGTIIGKGDYGSFYISIPNSIQTHIYYHYGKAYNWRADRRLFEPFIEKGQQLLFDFMNE